MTVSVYGNPAGALLQQRIARSTEYHQLTDKVSPLKNEATGFKRIIAAAGFSLQGLQAAYRHEAAFRQEVWLFLIAIPLAIWLGDSVAETLIMIGAVLFLMIVELLNSAVECVVDRIGSDYHELAGRAKDIGSAAVFLAVGLVIVVWVVVLLPD